MASPSFSPDHSDHRRVSLAHIDSIVSARLGPTRSLGKSQPACFNRQVAMYLASHVGRWSTTVIGRFFGGRDHSTVVHSIQRIEAMREMDPNLDILLCDLKLRIGVTAESIKEPSKRTLVERSLAGNQSEVRMLAREITNQVLDLLREEFHSLQHADRRSAGSSDLRSSEVTIAERKA